jgi:hypothetical protein
MKVKKFIIVGFVILLLVAIMSGCSDDTEIEYTAIATPEVYDNSAFPLADASSYYGDAFGDGEVIDIYVNITDSDWDDILDNPEAEEFYSADVVFNGTELTNVAFRTKGNSSLTSVAQDSDSDRYGFKIVTDKYVDDQTISGLNEFVLNNNYADPSYLREYLTYEVMDEIGGIVPNVAYCNLFINDNLFGFYLCVESYDDSFVERLTDDADACLYKAEDGCTLTTSDDTSGFDCDYGDDGDGSDYETFDSIKNLITVLNSTTDENKAELENILDVDSVLKAIAVNFVMGNYDSYNGTLAHNYYLLYADSKFTYIGWDYNMAFGTFAEDNGQSLTVDIESPLLNVDSSQRPLITKLLAIDEYYDIYLGYVEQIVDYYSDIETKIASKVASIRDYVANDPTAFYTVEEFDSNVTSSEEGVVVENTTTIGGRPMSSTMSITAEATALSFFQPQMETTISNISIVDYMVEKQENIANMLK